MAGGEREVVRVDGEATCALAQSAVRRVEPAARMELLEPIVDHPGYRHAVFRCELRRGVGRRRTVVVKRANQAEADAGREAAALRLLAGDEETDALVPDLLAHDPRHGLLVLEDLGTGPRLRDLLLGDDANLATTALRQLMRALATVNGRTHAAALRAERPALTVAPPPSGAPSPSLAAFERRLSGFEIEPSPGLHDELVAVTARRARPPLVALTIQDVAPSNAILHDGRLRLYDLEFAGYRNALIDGSYPWVRIFRANDAGRLPHVLREELAALYRAELACQVPAARDDDSYETALADALAIWTARVCAGLSRLVVRDRPRFRATERQRVLAALETFGEDAVTERRLPHMAAAARDLHDVLEHRWGGSLESLRPFPAFGG